MKVHAAHAHAAQHGARQIRVDVDGALAAEETRLAQALASRLAIPGSPEQWNTVADLRRGVKTEKLEDLDWGSMRGTLSPTFPSPRELTV